ncbi:MAG TPA: CDP-glucose 4,6-dehydratase [Acidisarcina sp.]
MEGLVGGSSAGTASAGTSWSGRRVFLTGHTGFKGGWLALWLTRLGAEVRGYALDPCTEPNLFTVAGVGRAIEDIRGDIRDGAHVEASMKEFRPEVVFHLAAQPLVRYSYEDPIGTYETNVIGTARVLDAVRRTPSVRALVSVTTDKCYENKEWVWPYRETDPLGGYDPYSSSKACAEIVSAAFRQSYFPVERIAEHGVAIATARAGNVIGGGDWSNDRLIPDLVRGFLSGKPVLIRRPAAIRPWQHVLEPLHGYIRLAEELLSPPARAAQFATAYNFGPSEEDARPVSWIAEHMTNFWGDGASWVLDSHHGPHEAGYLRLDASKARRDLQWSPKLNLETALEWLVQWYRSWQSGQPSGSSDMQAVTHEQIAAYSRLLL